MGSANNPLVTTITLIFGGLIGVIIAFTIAYFLGFVSWDRSGNAHAKPVSETPGMDMLNAYQCRKGETKQIILGGVEDDFSENGIEEIPLNAAIEDLFRQGGYRGSLGRRNYDEGGFDKFALDEFRLPVKTVHGLYVTRIKPLSELKNDGLTIGDYPNQWTEGNTASTTWYESARLPYWNYDNGLYSALLQDIVFNNDQLPKGFGSLIDYVRSDENGVPVYVNIADDTMVDFMGFTVCAEPEEHKGTVYVAGAYETPPGVVSFSCRDKDDVICNAYKGDKVCSSELPIICFRDAMLEKPHFSPIIKDLRAKNQFEYFWSGGEIKLTPPVRGDRFENSDDVNAYCAGLFGTDWRAASHHESFSDFVIGFGDAPDDTRAWIDVKDEPHGSCWKHRPEFETANE